MNALASPHERLRAVALQGAERNFAHAAEVVGVALVLRPGELRSVVSLQYDGIEAWQDAIRRAAQVPGVQAVAAVFEGWRASVAAVMDGFAPDEAPGRTEVVLVLIESLGKQECLGCTIKREGARASLTPWEPVPALCGGGFGNYFPKKGTN